MRNKRLTKRLSRIITVVAIAALTFTGTVPSFAAGNTHHKPPEIDSTSAVVMDAETGTVIYEKNAYEKRDPASITKILNCMVVLENMDMNQQVTIDYEPEKEGSVMHLQKGEKLTVQDLVYGMMVWSANDAAEALARLTADGNISRFCSMMNEKAVACGARDTAYTNPNGLNPVGKVNNITTAYDVALISARAMENPEFAKIVSTSKLEIPATNKYKKRKHKSSNRCLWDTKTKFKYNGVKTPLKYEGCKGIKTGYSSTAGDCFAGYAQKGKTRLIVVVLNASHEEPKFQDTIRLWDYGFDNYKTYYAASVGEVLGQQKVTRGSLREVDMGVEDDLAATVAKGYKASENTEINIETYNKKVKAPVKKGDVLGAAILTDENGNELARHNLVALETAEKGGLLSIIGIADEDVPIFIIVLLTILALVVILRIRKRVSSRKRRRRSSHRRNNER